MHETTPEQQSSQIRDRSIPDLGNLNAYSTSANHTLSASFYLLAAFLFVEYARPQEHVPVLASLRPGLVVGVLLSIAWLIKGDKAVLKDALIVLYVIFLLLVSLGIPIAVNNYWAFQTTITLMFYLAAVMLPSTAFLKDRHYLRKLIVFWLFIHVIIALNSVTGTGKGSGGFLSDENDWALALGMAAPYAYFLSQSPRSSKRMKFLFLAAFLVLVLAITATASRGGFIGLVAMICGLVYFSKNRLRNLTLLLVLGTIIFATVPSSYLKEIKSIADTQDNTRQERLYSWRRGWEMFIDNPVLGVGAGNYPWRVSEYEIKSDEYDSERMRLLGGRVAHSLYFTLLPELGLTGTLTYAAIVLLMFGRLRSIIHQTELAASKLDTDAIELGLFARAMIVSMLTFLVSGVFISVLYYPHLWYLLGFVIVLHRLATGVVAPPISLSADAKN